MESVILLATGSMFFLWGYAYGRSEMKFVSRGFQETYQVTVALPHGYFDIYPVLHIIKGAGGTKGECLKALDEIIRLEEKDIMSKECELFAESLK